MLVYRKVTHKANNSLYPFIQRGGESHCESKVSCPRTQHNDLGQGWNQHLSLTNGQL